MQAIVAGMRNACIGWLIVWLSLANTAARADVSIASMSPEVVHTALAAIDAARKIAQAGRGSLLMAGSALSNDEATSPMVLAVLADPDLTQARPGSILLLAKTDCEPVERCLVARRLIERPQNPKTPKPQNSNYSKTNIYINICYIYIYNNKFGK